MRDLATKSKILEFIQRFARETRVPVRVYLTGGSTAVLHGWRDSTVDIDLKFDPEIDELYRAIPKLKEELSINVELASPFDFIPEVPGWRERSLLIDAFGPVSFYHCDPYSQALSKIERAHEQDLLDIQAMLSHELIRPDRLLELFELIQPFLYKYPAIDQDVFAESVRKLVDGD